MYNFYYGVMKVWSLSTKQPSPSPSRVYEQCMLFGEVLERSKKILIKITHLNFLPCNSFLFRNLTLSFSYSVLFFTKKLVYLFNFNTEFVVYYQLIWKRIHLSAVLLLSCGAGFEVPSSSLRVHMYYIQWFLKLFQLRTDSCNGMNF